jgi:hypothetical protein
MKISKIMLGIACIVCIPSIQSMDEQFKINPNDLISRLPLEVLENIVVKAVGEQAKMIPVISQLSRKFGWVMTTAAIAVLVERLTKRPDTSKAYWRKADLLAYGD